MSESVGLATPLECAITFTGATTKTSVAPLALLKPSTTLEKNLIPKVISSSIGYGSCVTTKSTSIFPLSSLFLTSMCTGLEANPKWAYVLPKSKGDITKCGIICW
jgi:hypothetical protein